MKTRAVACELHVEWIDIPDKARHITTPQPGIQIVRICAKYPGHNVILKEETFRDKKESKARYDFLRQALGLRTERVGA